MTKEIIFAGLLGFGLGGGVIGFAVYGFQKKKYLKTLNDTVNNYEELLQNKSEFEGEDDIPEEFKRYRPSDKSGKSISESENPKISKDEKEVIKEKLRYNNAKTTAYASMYTSSIKDIVDAQAASEPDPEEVSKDTSNIFESAKDEDFIEAVEKAKEESVRSPVIITEDAYNDILDNHSDIWEGSNLFLYNDGTVTSEDDKTYNEEEVDKMLGNCLDQYDFRNSSEKTIFIKCFELNTVYEVAKINKPFIP